MNALDLTQVGLIKPIINELRNKGVNVPPLLHKAGLNKFSLANDENYLPVKLIYTFFNLLNREEGIEDCIESFGEQLELLSLAQWGEMIAYTPDLLTACQLVTKFDSVVSTHECAGFEIDGNKTTYWQYYVDEPTKEREQLVFISLAQAINGFFLAAGNDWAPLEIYIQSNSAPNLDKLLPTGYKTKIYLNQPRTAIVFPTSMLTLPMLGKKEYSNHINYSPNATHSMATNIERILDSYEEIPTINSVSEISDLSVRSLQRRLSDEQVTYFSIIDNWRFKRALDLLKDSKNSVSCISKELRYSNLPNFLRAFSRWTNTTPQKYREGL